MSSITKYDPDADTVGLMVDAVTRPKILPIYTENVDFLWIIRVNRNSENSQHPKPIGVKMCWDFLLSNSITVSLVFW